MATWADEDELEAIQSSVSGGSESDEELWDTIKPTVIREVDEHGNRIEITKKIRVFTMSRDAKPADIRKKLAPFGKGLEAQKDAVVAKEPPMALELGAADRFERESRAEVKRFVTENAPEDARGGGAREESRKDAEAGQETWASRKTTTTTERKTTSDVKRRVRVCNVSDDITEENLLNIFSANGAEVERVYLATDNTTGNNKGYAFITFRDEKYVHAAVKQRRFHFKNVVLSVSYAMDRKQ